MAIAIALGEVALQFFLLLLTFLGWGEVLASWHWTPDRRRRFHHLERTLLGLCGFTIFLLIAIYLNIPLKYSAWAALAVAVVGLGMGLGGSHRKWTAEEGLGLSVFTLVFLLQGLPLFYAGPGNYFASGHIDHYLYVNTGQFLVEKPIGLSPSAGRDEPWLQEPYTFLRERLGQDMPIGYLAVLLRVDTARAFGVVSIFFIAFLSLTVFACLRQLNLSRPIAWTFAVWLGVSNGITYSSTTSFLANSAVLFVLPSLTFLLWSRRHDLYSLRLAPALLLSYAFMTYTELFPWIAMGFLVMWLTLANWRDLRLWRLLGVNALVSLLFVGLFVPRMIFAVSQIYRYTFNIIPQWQEFMSNQSGTWRGWRQLFFATIDSRSFPWINALTLTLAISFSLLILWSLWIHRQTKSRYLTAIAGLIAFWPLLLLAMPTFKHYIFFKIVTTFLPLFFILLACAWARLDLSVNVWRLPRWIILAGCVLASLLSSALVWKNMIQRNDSLPQNTSTMRAIYDEVRQHPEKTYYVTDADPFRTGWIAYYARRSRVVLAPGVTITWGFPADPHAKPPMPPYTVLNGEHLPYEVK
ncbi:MAG: hypothetical protein B9S32_15965 [Verrucomicrobia bacterium Tous-C9LFEB]|nr:MAG: hypothetical protein B9S32_15965 [Verrucomicrobia bacterium Tous-C9LFEB]